MRLHIVVHHQKDPSQPYRNSWLDDERLEAITTPIDTGLLCAQAMKRGERVWVHRCLCPGLPSSVCCSAIVSQAAPIDKRTYLVTFVEHTLINQPPQFCPPPGTNHY